MQLFYNEFPLHEVGELVISQSRQFEGGEAPQRAVVTFRVKVTSFARSYADNMGLMDALVSKLKTQHAMLRWVNDDTGVEWVNQTATVQASDFPEDKSGWGQYMMEQGIVFTYYETDVVTNNLPATFQAPGLAVATLGNVIKWSETYQAKRFSELRAQRRNAEVKLSVSGMFQVDMTLPLAERRKQLMETKTAWLAQFNNATGTLTFGTWSQTIKVEDFKCDIDQMVSGIPWSFTAVYTIFPDVTDYAIAEWTVALKDAAAGYVTMTLQGKVTASSEATARNKWATIRTVVLAQQEFTDYQTLQLDSTPSAVSADDDGDAFLEVSFNEEYRQWDADNVVVSFTANIPNATAVDMGNITKWQSGYQVRRFNDLHPQRDRAGGTIVAAGTWVADATLPIDQRRAALEAKRMALESAVNHADGRLLYGSTFDQIVRVEDLKAEVDQEKWAVTWTMTAGWTRFPNEAGFATVEFTVELRQNIEEGDEYLILSGRIFAQDELAALAKLTSIRASVLSQYGFTMGNLLRPSSTPSFVDANEDGKAFTVMPFSEEYRHRIATLVSYNVKVADKTNVRGNLIQTSYSGWVSASGATVDAAYEAALAQAETLGKGKYPFLESSTIQFEQRRVQAAGDNPSPLEFVRLEFSYDYQRRGTMVYLEWTSETNLQTFGVDSESIHGYVAAADIATARAAYESQVKASYAGRLIRDEVTTESRQKVNLGSGYTEQQMKVDFSFSVYKAKAAGKIGMRYGINFRVDVLELKIDGTVEGEVFASDNTTAEAFANSFIAGLGYGDPVRYGNGANTEVSGEVSAHLGYRFFYEYSSALTGITGVLECQVTEDLKYSGPRNVVMPVLNGVSIVQNTGTEAGSRGVSGWVTAPDEATARAWALLQRNLLTGDDDDNHYENPPQMTTEWTFVPRIVGVARGDGINVRVAKVSFQFSEILPNYPLS